MPAIAAEIDSIHVTITPVQCFGLRNGAIQVDTVFGGVKPFFYSLDGQTFTTNPTFDRLWAGEYTLYVRDASGETKDWDITVKEPFELKVRLVASDTNVLAGEVLTLRALASVETDFLKELAWTPLELFQKQDTIRHQLFISETTQFSIVVTDHRGCTASDELTVSVNETKLYFPNVINPSSPSDSYFTVFAGDGVRRVVSLQVFSREGSLVFERLDFQPNAPLQGWGGRWNGKRAPNGVYPYLAKVEMLDGKQKWYEGTVTLVN